MHLAYLINQYPAVSHTFIRREIHALEQVGHTVERFSIRDTQQQVIDPLDVAEAQKTTVLLEVGPCVGGVFRVAFTRPSRFLGALMAAIGLNRRSRRGLAPHLAYLAEACRLYVELRRLGVEHLHAHFGTNSAAVAMLCRILGGPPFSFTVHGPEELDRPEEESLAEKISTSTFVVAISSFGRAQLQRWVARAQWSKIHLVRCGVDSTLTSDPTVPPIAARLVCVGRLSEQKGHFVLLEAAGRLARQGLVFDLVLVGDGPLRDALEKLVLADGLTECVRFVGSQSGDQVRNWIDASRCLVLPSFAEGLPVVIMEAFARGRPVVTTYVAGIPELVIPGKNGWLAPAGSVDHLVEALDAALSMPVETLSAMGEHGRSMVLELHSVEKEVQRLAELFSASSAP